MFTTSLFIDLSFDLVSFQVSNLHLRFITCSYHQPIVVMKIFPFTPILTSADLLLFRVSWCPESFLQKPDCIYCPHKWQESESSWWENKMYYSTVVVRVKITRNEKKFIKRCIWKCALTEIDPVRNSKHLKIIVLVPPLKNLRLMKLLHQNILIFRYSKLDPLSTIKRL